MHERKCYEYLVYRGTRSRIMKYAFHEVALCEVYEDIVQDATATISIDVQILVVIYARERNNKKKKYKSKSHRNQSCGFKAGNT